MFAAEPDHTVVGLGVAATPGYQGSDNYVTSPAPLIDIRRGRFFAKTDAGIGFDLFDTGQFAGGVSVAWMRGYDDKDAPRGFDELKSALGGRVFLTTRIGGALATLSATQALTEKERGMLVTAGMSYPYALTGRLRVVPAISLNWANEKYMTGYFGVNAAAAERSGFALYTPEAGLKDVSLRLGLSYQLTDKWSLAGAVLVNHLLDQAADSPIVVRKSQASAVLGLTYAF